MLVVRRQLYQLANDIDGAMPNHTRFVEELGRFADDASGADLYMFVNALKRSLELEDKKK